MLTRSSEYDLFISYAHSDNDDGSVTALVEAIKSQHRRFTSEPLRIFFDTESICSMDDWEHHILRGIRESKLMLAVLSPAYFNSLYCRREWETYIEHEMGQAMPGEAIAPIYIATDDNFDHFSDTALNEWMRNLKRRQYVDVRNWWKEGPKALQQQDVLRRLERLEQDIDARLRRLTSVRSSPSTVPESNPRFVGRRDTIEKLRAKLALGRIGTITAVNGIGGMGKSALAFQYAHAYASEYPGGRFLIPCEGVTELPSALAKLVPQLGMTLSDSESKDLESVVSKVNANLEARSRTLLILDNVDHSELLAPRDCSRYLPDAIKVHVLVTTRLPPVKRLDIEWIAVDALSEESALELFARHRPIPDDNWKHARKIISRLGGHPLALEVVAQFLGHYDEVSYADYLARLEEDGLEALEETGEDPQIQLSRNSEKLLSKLLEPTLSSLSCDELMIAELAACMHPDHVFEHWLKKLTGEIVPRFLEEVRPGHPDPFMQAVRRLVGLRILTNYSAIGDGSLFRMHRLVRDVINKRMGSDREANFQKLCTLLRSRIEELRNNWEKAEHRWETVLLLAHAYHCSDLNVDEGAKIANLLSEPLRKLGNYFDAERMLNFTVQNLKSRSPANTTDLGKALSNSGVLQRSLGNLPEARSLMQLALEIFEADGTMSQTQLARMYTNLGAIETDLGNYETALPWIKRAIKIFKSAPQRNYPALARSFSHLARLERYMSNLNRSRKLYREVVDVARGLYGSEHPEVATYLGELAAVERDLANFAETRNLLSSVVNIHEKSFDKDHPKTATSYLRLGSLEQTLAHYGESERCMDRAMEILRNCFDRENLAFAAVYAGKASLDQVLARYGEARKNQLRAFGLRKEYLESNHPTMASSYAGLGSLEHELANFDEARRWLNMALEIRESKRQQDLASLASIYSSIASLESTLGASEEAYSLHEKSLLIREQLFDAHHPVRASSYASLAVFAQSSGDLIEARKLHTRALAIREEVFESDHPSIASSYAGLASLELKEGNVAIASDYHKRSLAIREQLFGPYHPNVASSYAGYAKVLVAQGDLVGARERVLKAACINQSVYGDQHPSFAKDLALLAQIEQKLGNQADAQSHMRSSWTIRHIRFGSNHFLTREAQRWLKTYDPGSQSGE